MSRVASRFRIAALAAAATSVVALVLASSAMAANVPVTRTLIGRLVRTSSVSSGPARPVQHPFLARNEQQYQAAKAAATVAYGRWAARHRLALNVFGPLTSPSIISLNKPGLGASVDSFNNTPPDPTGAASPGSYFEFVNSYVAVYNRTTLASPPTAQSTEDSFVGSKSTCDGQIKWNQFAQRYEYWDLDCAAAKGSEGFSIGWSKTASPTPLSTNWCKYHFSTGSTLYDYGKLGTSNQFMMIGANEYSDSTGSYAGSPIVLIQQPANGSTTCPSSVGAKQATPASTFTPEPATMYGSSTTGYVVATTGSLPSTKLNLFTVTGTFTSPAITGHTVTVPSFNTPAGVPQPSPAPAKDVIDSSDTRLTQANAVLDPGLKSVGIWTQHTIAGSGGGPSVVRWYELEVGKSTPQQTGTVSVSGEFVFNGAISPTTAGNAAAIDYNVGGKSMLVQLRARVHPAGSTAGSMTSETTLATSKAVDEDFSCPSVTGSSRPCRWGDYGGASFDPLSSTDVFGTNQYNGALGSGNKAQWLTNNFRLVT